MRILAIAEFDPAGVMISHRDALRSAGVDFRVALQCAYTDAQRTAEWVAEVATGPNPLGRDHSESGFGSPVVRMEPTRCNVASLVQFAVSADVLVMCPGIGQPWADGVVVNPQRDAPLARYFGIDWRAIAGQFIVGTTPDGRRRDAVAFFHGSTCAAANISHYRRAFQGWKLAASTLDYAHNLAATYLPPVVNVGGPLAPLRCDDDPLIVAHCPTNPAIASTDDFFRLAHRLGIVVRYAHRRTHEESLAAKRGSHATFDHLRGAFSVNSVEAAALGSVPLFTLRKEYRDPSFAWSATGFPMPRDMREIGHAMELLRDDAPLTRIFQRNAVEWHARHFTRDAVLPRLRDFYGVTDVR